MSIDKKVDNKHYIGHFTFWHYIKKMYNIERPTKYCVIFNTYTENPGAFSVTSFETLDEALEEAKLINIMYSDTPKPEKIYLERNGKYTSKKRWGSNKTYNLDFSNGSYFWGYMVLDMINKKVIKIVNTIKHCGFTFNEKITLSMLDVLFRDEDEIPTDYQWDTRGEYDGWLQFRWGDGKNALDYVEPKNNDKIIKPIVKTSNIIDENDYSEDYLPCTLAEEIAVDEYINNGGSFDKKDITVSIADILGKDNPLLKLKFD